MELTLTGASLSSEINPKRKSKHDHGHNHNHNHSHDDDCCKEETKDLIVKSLPDGVVRSNKESKAVALERLIASSDSKARANALTTAVKVGTFEGFERIAILILEQEKNDFSKIKSELCEFIGDHTLAHWASKRKELQFLEFLSSDKVLGGLEMLHVPTKDDAGMRPIHWAATSGSIPVVAFLLEKLQSSIEENKILTPKKSNLYSRESEVVSTIPMSYDSIINARDKSGNTPLIIAAQYGHADLCAFFIKRGADPKAVDHSLDSAMHWAAYKGSVPVIGSLCHIGWNNERENKHYNNHSEWISLQDVDAYGQTPLHLASLRGNADAVQYLLEEVRNRSYYRKDKSRNSRINIQSRQESDPLRYLLTLSDKDGKTPMDLAKTKKKPACVMVLQEWEEKLNLGMQNQNFAFAKIARLMKMLLSLKQWKLWMGMGTLGHDRNATLLQQQKMKFPFILLSGSMIVASLVYPYKFTPIFNVTKGLLWDYTFLHMTFYLFEGLGWYAFLKTWLVNPGVLGEDNGRNSSVAYSLGRKKTCFSNDNEEELANISQKYKALYDETLECYAVPTMKNTLEQENKFLPLCHSCHIARPLRSKHCKIRRKCVLVFDHYCPFVGNVVGMYNYAYFYFFLLFLMLAQILFLVTAIIHERRVKPFDWGLCFFCVYVLIMMIPGTSLLVYHTLLIKKNLTTNEHQNWKRYSYLKDDRNEYYNPWKRSFFQNLMNRVIPMESLYTLPIELSTRDTFIEHGTDDNEKRDSEKDDLISNAV